jgi:hypothetical protein
MATASRALRRPFVAVGAVAAVIVAADLVTDGNSTSSSEPTVVRVTATSPYQFDSLLAMADASDLVVTGTVVATERGRLVGEPNGGGIVSRLVTIDVDDVLLPEARSDVTTILVEEEGWLPTGEVLLVDDLAPSAVGDSGVWFLDALDGTDAPTLVVINSQGRFLDVGGAVVGGRIGDPLVDAVEAVEYAELVDTLRQLSDLMTDAAHVGDERHGEPAVHRHGEEMHA